MDWRQYEDSVCEALRQAYPGTMIKRDVKLLGRQSKAKRQIDVLVEYYLLGQPVRIIVDAKHYDKRIDVKDVESFISMVEDTGAIEGILVTEHGYSKAALIRAHNSPTNVTLDIFSLKELEDYQGFEAVVHSGTRGVTFPAPFGWVIDANGFEGSLATMYQRGKTIEQATATYEFMYVNVFAKDSDIQTIADLVKHQGKYLKKSFPNAKLLIEQAVPRLDSIPTLLRKAEIDVYPALEFTGFVEFEHYIFFCVLFTPEVLQSRNLRKIQSILEKAEAKDMTAMFVERIQKLEVRLTEPASESEQSDILFNQGKYLRQIKRFEEAHLKLDASIAAEPKAYMAYREKVVVDIESAQSHVQIENSLNSWFESAPLSGTLVIDLIDLMRGLKLKDLAISFLKKKGTQLKSNNEAAGLIFYQMGIAYMLDQQTTQARQALKRAKELFAKTIPDDDEIMHAIEGMLALMAH